MPRDTEVKAPGDAEANRPVWLQAAYVTALSAAVIVPGVTLLDHWLDHRLESARHNHAVELERNKLEHEIRQTYLDRAVDPHRTPEYRRSVLAFMEVTLADDGPLQQWAAGERQRLERFLRLQAELAASEARVTMLKAELSRASSSPRESEQEIRTLREEFSATQEEVETLRRDLDVARQEGNLASTVPSGSTVFAQASETAAGNQGSQNGATAAEQTPRKGSNSCCIVCNGVLICGTSVETECGSCEGAGD
jgi:DNA repair exonuclease SbcCD ATPase subunit